MKIGIMGGTFDPIHNGHLMLGHAAYETFSLDQIWFMPNGNPPHKKSETIKSTAEDRMKMTSLAIAPFPEFVQIRLWQLRPGYIRSGSSQRVRSLRRTVTR